MSLLMDALKKAEEEKKQAAKRLQEVEIEVRETISESAESDIEANDEVETPVPEIFTETSQFSLEPLSLAESFDETKDGALTKDIDEKEISTEDVSETFSEDLTLENTISEDVESAQESFEETQNAIDLNDTTIIEGLSSENASAPFDDTFHGVLIEEEEQDTDVYEETLPGVPADQLAKDLGGGKFQPTPVAAKTVFSASGSHKKQSSFKWSVLVLLTLLAVGSFSVFYYFTITPVSRNLPSPLIARGIEFSGVEQAIVTPPIISQSPDNDVLTEGIITSVIEEAESQIDVTEKDISEVQPILNEITINQDSEQVKITELIVEEVERVETQNDVVDEVYEELEVEQEIEKLTAIDNVAKESPENIQVDSSLISISKSKTLEQENVMVTQAFKAYQYGHLDAAKSIYEDVLKNDPDNRDAHLGLGAIAISKQDRKNAYSHYVHLLELNPSDTLAMNALIGLSNSADLVKDESAIKSLIQREDNVPYLYFSLGNIFAKQKRWASAQQAFFDAYRLDTTNADYVLNLAISLDQIGQYDTALDYYKTAIDLSENSSTRFDSASINNRILVLSKLNK